MLDATTQAAIDSAAVAAVGGLAAGLEERLVARFAFGEPSHNASQRRRRVAPALHNVLHEVELGAEGGPIVGYIDGAVACQASWSWRKAAPGCIDRHNSPGLGNILYMLAAVRRCTPHVFLVDNELMRYGTNWQNQHMQAQAGLGARPGRPNRGRQRYTTSIFRDIGLANASTFRVARNGSGSRPPLARYERSDGACPNASFLFRAYGQTHEVQEAVPLLLQSLHWPDVSDALRSARYAGVRQGTCIGVRMGSDFKGRFITPARYRSALAHLRMLGEDLSTVYVVTDVPNAWETMRLENESRAVVIEGEDVEQLAIGRHCRNFVLSRSTYHSWLVYAAVRPRHVIYFNHSLSGVWEDTERDPLQLGLTQPSWMKPWIMLP